MIKHIEEYHQRVDDGRILVSKKMLLQIERTKRYLKDYEYDEEAAKKAIDFIERFTKHYKGKFAGKPFILSLWQKYIVSVIFGFYHYIDVDIVDENGELIKTKKERRRLTKEAIVIVARKNGKSLFASAIQLYMLVADGESAPEVYSVANKLDQAKIVYNNVMAMSEKSPLIRKRLKKRRTDIECTVNDGMLAPLANDSKTLDGLNPSFVVFDEIHETVGNEMYTVMNTALGARENPILFMISTNGMLRGKFFDDKYTEWEAILSKRVIDDTKQIFIFEQDSQEEIDDEKNWIKSNPNIDISCDRNWLREQHKSIYTNPSDKNAILSKNFNIPQESFSIFFEYDGTLMSDVDVDAKMIDTYGVFGLDLSKSYDLSCLTYLFSKDGIKYIKQWYFLPKLLVDEKEKEDKVPYKKWSEQGHLVLIDEDYIKPISIFEFMQNKVAAYNLYPQKIGYDYYYAGEFENKVKENYGDYMAMVVRQGAATFSAPLNQTKKELESGTMKHNSPMLQWCLLNTTTRKDANDNDMIEKKNRIGRIDGTASLMDAVVAFNEVLPQGLVLND